MNHGDGIGGRGRDDDFGRAVSRVAVAQVCESVGFQGVKESALEALSEIAIRYLCDLGKTSNFNANLTGRTESNVFDIVRALEGMEFSQGFPGAADAGRCLVGSGAVKELTRYVGLAEEVPFAQPVARFPVAKPPRQRRQRQQQPATSGDEPPVPVPDRHIPGWLPPWPEAHTYLRTGAWGERRTDPREDKIEVVRQRRKAERSLLSLQQRLAGDNAAAERNPFLEPPLPPGEKEEVLPPPPAGGVMEVFGPAIEAVKNGFLEQEEDEAAAGDEEGEEGGGRRRELVAVVSPPEMRRPAVNFKIRTAKKYLVESVDLRLGKKATTGYWFTRDEERGDDKKRRAEFILRQSIDNPQDLNQM